MLTTDPGTLEITLTGDVAETDIYIEASTVLPVDLSAYSATLIKNFKIKACGFETSDIAADIANNNLVLDTSDNRYIRNMLVSIG